jgi:hypothetical protein
MHLTNIVTGEGKFMLVPEGKKKGHGSPCPSLLAYTLPQVLAEKLQCLLNWAVRRDGLAVSN